MDEETIIINDLLSFIWCKTKTTPKNILLKCVEAFYSEQFAADALHSLITAVSFNIKRELSTNPFEAIIDFIKYSPTDQLPTFVCRNLNNVPDIDSVSQQMMNNCPEDIYNEHKRIVCELDVLNKSLSNLSEQLNRYSENNHGNIINKVEAVNRKNGSRHQNSGGGFDVERTKTIIKMEPEEGDVEEESFDVMEDVNFLAYEELRMGLIANRYQRALARSAEKGNEERKTKKFKPIVFDSTLKSSNQRVENVLSPSDTIFPSSCKVNVMNSSVSKIKRTTAPYGSLQLKKSDAEDGSIIGSTQRYLSEVPTPDYKVLNILCAENSERSQISNAAVTKADNEGNLRMQYPCPLCSNGFFEEDWTNHVRICQGDGTRNPNDLRCRTCNCFFADKKMLGFHMGYHDIARQHGCNECGYRFYTSKALEGHMKLHSPLCKNKCPFCNFKTFKAGRVKEHVRSHTGEKPYKCKLCDYASTTYDILRGHIKSHSVVKEYFKCGVCNKTFHNKNKLKFHEQSHGPDGKRKCNMCEKGYHASCTSSYCKRKTIQVLYPCPECPFKDKDLDAIRDHMKKRHPLKKYSTPTTKLDYIMSNSQFKSCSQRKSMAHSPS